MQRRRVVTPSQPRNGEDIQPNEARGLPKGAGVPIVRSLPKAKLHRERRYDTGGWRGRQGNRGGRFSVAAERQNKTIEARGYQNSTHNTVPLAGGTANLVSARPYLENRGLQTPILQDTRQSNCEKSQEDVDVFSQNSSPCAKRTRVEDTISKLASRKMHRSQKSGRKPKDSDFTYDWQTMIIDVPIDCKIGAANVGQMRYNFVRDYIPGFKSTMGAKVKEYKWNDDRLVIIYAIKDQHVQQENASMTTNQHRRGAESEEVRTRIASGSNVKLEDQPIILSQQLIHKEKEASDQNGSNNPPLLKRPFVIFPSSFVSGVLTLSYGPSREVREEVDSEITLTPSQPENLKLIGVKSRASTISISDDDEEPPIKHNSEFPPAHEDDTDDQLLTVDRFRGNRQGRGLYMTEVADGVPLPRHNYDKPRRILVSRARNRTYIISMHGRFYEITRSAPRRYGEVDIFPTAGSREFSIDDACVLDSPFDHLAVVGQTSEENALSLVDLSGNTQRRFSKIPRTSLHPDRMLRGVSAVHALPVDPQPKFITGGYDHTVELWTVDDSLTAASSMSLTVRHQSTIHSLTSMRDTSLKAISAGADCLVNIWDVASERNVKYVRTSNIVYHVHPTEAKPGCILFEVAHRDSQFELHDYRAAPDLPMLRFGYLSASVRGRYIKGDVRGNSFVCGDKYGFVLHWDFRNPKRPVQRIEAFPGQKIVQVAFDDDSLAVVPEDNRLLFINVERGEWTSPV